MVTEFHALTVLREFGFAAAETQLLISAGRYFLESKRFDRIGRSGRKSMLSMKIIDAEFADSGDSWTQVAQGLYDKTMMSHVDLELIKQFQLFGRLINNTDMHLGNLSFSMNGNLFSLLPAYDMCSMGFAQKGTEVTELDFALPDLAEIKIMPKTRIVLNAAAEFWRRIELDDRASEEMRQLVRSKKLMGKLSG